MTLDTLIEILTDYRDEFGGEAEVRLMTQQSWPFENRICGVTSGRDMNEADDEDEAAAKPRKGSTLSLTLRHSGRVATGTRSGSASGEAFPYPSPELRPSLPKTT